MNDNIYTVVIPDSNLFFNVCGANDGNLKYIEEVLNLEIFTRGNEISVLAKNEDNLLKFKYCFERLLDEAADGDVPCPDMIKAILNIDDTENYEQNSSEKYRKACIKISGGLKTIFPKSLHQAQLIQSMDEKDMVFAVGPAGSGKTYLAMAKALSLLLQHQYKKIILTRPVVEAGESLGFLPGDLEQKINPYLRPLYDAMENLVSRDVLRKLTESAIIEIAPLAYMRGRTLANSVIILDEAQNTTREQMKMFLTRLGENSKAFITGDITQIDLPKKVKSGLVEAVDVLCNIEDIAIHYLDTMDVVRNPLVKKIIQAYENAKEE